MEFKLSRPIKTHKGGDTTDTLTLKEPTARTFVTHGNPFQIKQTDGAAEYIFDNKASMGFLASMTGHNDIELSAIAAKDFYPLRYAMAHVILVGLGENPTPPSAT